MRSDFPCVDPLTGLDVQRQIPPPVSSLCFTGISKYNTTLTGFLLDFLRQQWSLPTNIANEQLRRYLWKPDPVNPVQTGTDSKIYIESATRWDARIVQQRPAILVKRNAFQEQKVAIGDRAFSTPYRINTPTRAIDVGTRYTVLCAGSYTCFAVAREGEEAEAMATEIFLRLLEFAPVVVRELGLTRFRPMALGSVSKIEEDKDHWVLPVPVAIAYTHAWRLAPQAPSLNAASITMSKET